MNKVKEHGNPIYLLFITWIKTFPAVLDSFPRDGPHHTRHEEWPRTHHIFSRSFAFILFIFHNKKKKKILDGFWVSFTINIPAVLTQDNLEIVWIRYLILPSKSFSTLVKAVKKKKRKKKSLLSFSHMQNHIIVIML